MTWTRGRRLAVVAGAAAVGLAVAAGYVEREIEARLGRRLAAESSAHGFDFEGRVDFSWLRPLRVEGLRLRRPGLRIVADEIDVDWKLAGGRDARSHLRSVALTRLRVFAPGLHVLVPATAWRVDRWHRAGHTEELVVREELHGGILRLDWRRAEPVTVRAELVRLDAGAIGRLRWNSRAVMAPGLWSGSASFERAGAALRSEGTVTAEEFRVAAIGAPDERPDRFGAPSPLHVRWAVEHDGGRWQGRADGSFGGVQGGMSGTLLDGRLRGRAAAHVDLARALHAFGLGLPVDPVPVTAMGHAAFETDVAYTLGDPLSLLAHPSLTFEPPDEPVGLFDAYRGPFTFAAGNGVSVDVRDGAPGFVPLDAVPPLLVRALVISEDAGFWGHPGIDVGEIPVAWVENQRRGRSAFGASTITQQLVKNLFLSRDKTWTRKLQEAALALLLDAALPKQRILEIYLNVIEWGPALHGIGPAARHYFGKAPAELTPREIAFLVCLIPSPVRYHQAHDAGRVGPGLDRLVDNLLAKLHSVEAIDPATYEAALAEEIHFAEEAEIATRDTFSAQQEDLR